MPQQLSSSLELPPRRGHVEGHILLHLMPSFRPSGRTEGIEEAENKRGAYRDSEELGKETKVRRQRVWELPRQKSPIYDQPPNDAGLRRGNWESGLPLPVVIGPLSHWGSNKIVCQIQQEEEAVQGWTTPLTGLDRLKAD